MKYRLDELFDLQMGKTPARKNPEYWNVDENKWISIADLSKCGKYINATKESISNKAVSESGIMQIPKNTVIMSFKLSIGKTAITSEPMYSNEAIISFRDKHVVEIMPEYLYYLILSKDWNAGTNKAVMGKTLNKATLSKVTVNIHNIVQQHKIVETLDKVNNVVMSRQRQLKKLDELVKSRFIELFGDPIQNTKGWPIRKLSECIQFLTSGSRGWAKHFTDEGEYFITIKNVKNCRITLDDVQHIVPPNNAEAKRTKVREGDLLISITADLGRTGVVTREIAEHGGYINQHLTCIRIDQKVARPLYVAYYMESEAGKSQFRSKNQSAVKAGLNFNAINSLCFMLPPIELQDSFIDFIKQTDKSKFVIQQALDKAQLLFDSLMQKYFG